MKELKAIVQEYQKIENAGIRSALATVVRVKGSSYRSPGARMLIMEDGKWVGSISGGCLEGDALRKARQVMQTNVPSTVTYDTREESNQNLGISLGCNGVIDVFIEPIEPNDPKNPISLFKTLIDTPTPFALATIFKASKGAGERLLINSKLETLQQFTDSSLTKTVLADLSKIFDKHVSYAHSYESDTDVFIELIQPSISIILFGAGFDARPVSHLAKSLGWNVTVTDECVAHIAPLFFPSADKLSLCQRQWIDRDFIITPYTACVLMSHNYDYDRDVLKKLFTTDTPYIGILGPRKRFDKMLEELAAQGIEISSSAMSRIHSPIGLDIGAETADEIALAIVAEIQSKFTNRSGGFLKYRNSPIHQRDRNTDHVFKQFFINNSHEDKSKLA